MSTDHQRYSTENQADAIRHYAASRGFEIVQTYADAGTSGLRIDGRDALKRLIEDVAAGRADFSAILALRGLHPDVIETILAGLRAFGGGASRDPVSDLIDVNGELLLSVVIARCFRTAGGPFRWRPRLDTSLRPDLTVVVRMDAANRAPLDYYILPRIDLASATLRMAEENGLGLDGYPPSHPIPFIPDAGSCSTGTSASRR